MTQYNLIVIGAGAAGGPCAEAINAAGGRVALIERNALGGTCLNYGCDPTKAALHWAKRLYGAAQNDISALSARPFSISNEEPVSGIEA